MAQPGARTMKRLPRAFGCPTELALEHRLAPTGRSLRPLLQQLYDWGDVQADRLGATIMGRAEVEADGRNRQNGAAFREPVKVIEGD